VRPRPITSPLPPPQNPRTSHAPATPAARSARAPAAPSPSHARSFFTHALRQRSPIPRRRFPASVLCYPACPSKRRQSNFLSHLQVSSIGLNPSIPKCWSGRFIPSLVAGSNLSLRYDMSPPSSLSLRYVCSCSVT